MTADRIPALLEPIQNRLNAVTPGPWTDALGKTFKAVGSIADARFIVNAPTDQARLLAAVQAVVALAEEWRYKGEFGWGAWQEGHGPDPEGAALDHASSLIRAAVESALRGEA